MKKYFVILLGVCIYACSNKHQESGHIPYKRVMSVPAPQNSSSVPEQSDPHCPAGMVYVEGDWCADLDEPCLSWEDTKEVDDWNAAHATSSFRRNYNICHEFKFPTVCKSKHLRHVKFCMDVYEFPNVKGTIPDVMMSYLDMEKLCGSQGKRVCKDYEFNKACEGPENKPYPYGYKRDVTACNINKPYRDWDMEKISHRDWDEVKRLDQRVASGAYEKCVSDYGVHDIVGNVDEFYTNSYGVPYKSAMMGGHWIHGARNRCRGATTAHNEWFYIYEAGGRCCQDPKE